MILVSKINQDILSEMQEQLLMIHDSIYNLLPEQGDITLDNLAEKFIIEKQDNTLSDLFVDLGILNSAGLVNIAV
jgi:hypothetical protein